MDSGETFGVQSFESERKYMLKSRKGQFYIIMSAMLFGIMPFLTKTAYNNGSNAYAVVFWRFSWTSIFMAVIIKKFYAKNILLSKDKMLKVFVLSIFYGITPILLYISYNYIDSGMATTLHFTYPIAVMIIMAVFFKEKMGKRKLLCAIVCIMGVIMLYSPEKHVGVKGMALAVISGIVYSLYVIFLEKFKLKGESVIILSFWLCFFTAIETGVFSVLIGKFRFTGSPQELLAELCLAFFSTVIALVLFQKGTFLCGAVMASLLSTFEPLTGVVIGWIVFKEKMTLKLGIGILLILFSTVLVALPAKGKKKM